MEKPKYNRLLLFLFLLLIDIGACGILTFFIEKYTVEIAELYADKEFLGIKGISSTITFLPVFFMLIIMTIAVLFSMKISGIMHPWFVNQISSSKIKLDNEYLNTNSIEGDTFYAINDRFLVVRYKNRKLDIIITCCAITLLFIVAILEIAENECTMRYDSGFFISLGLICSLTLVYLLFSPAKKLVFDRINGIVTLPGFFILPSATVPFDEIIQTGWFSSISLTHHKAYYMPKYIPGSFNSDWWSFYVWYMDKNRPLPSGKLFDTYREADYQRRKADGFKPPVYPSTIEIKEWKGAEVLINK